MLASGLGIGGSVPRPDPCTAACSVHGLQKGLFDHVVGVGAPLTYFCSPHHQDSALYPFVGQLTRAADSWDEAARHIEADNVAILWGLASTSEEVMMGSSRNMIIGAIVIVVLIAAYYWIRGYHTGPESIPAASTETKK